MEKRIREQSLALAPLITALRRDLHKHPEKAWSEYRTTSLIARHLSELGYSLVMGQDAHVDSLRCLVPDTEKCAQERARAISQGGDPKLIHSMGKGFTGLWADLQCPAPNTKAPQTAAKGPCIALRFDIDALELTESTAPSHRPACEGFASTCPGLMHGCGHDGHTAIGMGVAAIIKSLQNTLRGTVRLIFQPAEEGGLGAAPMTAAGAVDGVDVIIGLHLGVQAQDTGDLICGTSDFLATSTMDVRFDGKAAHAGIAPQMGQNALLAACTATLNMHAISRHGDGETRINVGQMTAGDATNIIPAHAKVMAETRGISSALNTYMVEESQRIIEAAAHMWHCRSSVSLQGECQSGNSDPEVAAVVEELAHGMGQFTKVQKMAKFAASEDFTSFLNKVQSTGGKGTYIQVGTKRAAGHHSSTFDFDEAAIAPTIELLARLTAHYLK